MKKIYLPPFWVLFLFIYSNELPAQQVSDSLWLDEVRVSADRLYIQDKYQAVSISRIDSMTLSFVATGNLSDALAGFAPAFIRSNGPGGLATISQRGFSPSQTQVVWNGFELNHSMLGLADLSLITSVAVEEVVISLGSGNTSFGDKGGGSIAVETAKPKNKVGFSQSVGSFGRNISEAYGGITFKKWEFGVIAGYENSDNDFVYLRPEFSNEEGGYVDVEKRRANNELESYTGIFSADWKEEKKEFRSILWIYDAHNHIPGGVSGLSPLAYQEDAFVRWLNSYSTSVFNQPVTAKLYLNRQRLDFINRPAAINSRSVSTSFQADLEMKNSLHRTFQLVSAIRLSHSLVDASDYSGNAERSQFSANINSIWSPLERLYLYNGFRFDYYSDFREAYSLNAGLNVELLRDYLFLKGQAARNYVAPTFNDLYWPGLGNPDLSPETNIKLEAGILANLPLGLFKNSFELTIYDGTIYDGIRWIPDDEGQSRPQNLEQVDSRGFELQGSSKFKTGIFSGEIQLQLLRTIAKLEEPRFPGDEAVGRQLRYTPEWQMKSYVMLRWGGLSTLLSYTLTEERFSSADHNSPFDPLPAYELTNWTIKYRFTLNHFELIPSFAIQNLMDNRYSIIQDYPMPGRSYQGKLTITYTLK